MPIPGNQYASEGRLMYVITSNATTGTAETIPTALAVFAAQLREALPAGGVRWSIVDPAGLEHPGHITLNGRLDLLQHAVRELCDDLYDPLQRSADGYRGV
jgi:hypothetical protein